MVQCTGRQDFVGGVAERTSGLLPVLRRVFAKMDTTLAVYPAFVKAKLGSLLRWVIFWTKLPRARASFTAVADWLTYILAPGSRSAANSRSMIL